MLRIAFPSVSIHLNANIRFKKEPKQNKKLRDAGLFPEAKIKRSLDGVSSRIGELFQAETCQGVSASVAS